MNLFHVVRIKLFYSLSSFILQIAAQYRNCTSTEYRCENGRCVTKSATCNG
jgi:hypothetical protein